MKLAWLVGEGEGQVAKTMACPRTVTAGTKLNVVAEVMATGITFPISVTSAKDADMLELFQAWLQDNVDVKGSLYVVKDSSESFDRWLLSEGHFGSSSVSLKTSANIEQVETGIASIRAELNMKLERGEVITHEDMDAICKLQLAMNDLANVAMVQVQKQMQGS